MEAGKPEASRPSIAGAGAPAEGPGTTVSELVAEIDRLARANRELESLLASARIAMLLLDDAGDVRRVTPAVEAIYEVRAAEAVGRPLASFAHRAVAMPPLPEREAVHRAAMPFEHEVEMRDGSWYLRRVMPHRTAEGVQAGLVVTFTDVTKRKRSEARASALARDLARRAAESETLLEILPVGVGIAHDPGCRNITANSVFRGILGVRPGANTSLTAPEGERPTNFVVERDGVTVPPEELPLQVAARDRVEVRDIEAEVVRSDGRRIHLLEYAAPLFDEEGRSRGSVGAFIDVTSRKKAEVQLRAAEQALRDADRHKDEFLALLAHELRNPLASLRAGLHVLARSISTDARGKRGLSIMDRQISHMVRLIGDLLDVSRIRRGELDLKRERVTLGSILDVAVETARPFIDARRQELHVRVPDEPVILDADPARVAQAVGNLLHNAAKFTPECGRIELAADLDGDDLVIRVADSGTGIPREMLSRVFEMFTQVDDPLHRAQGGLGIGLSLVKRVVDLHGGSVCADSPGPDQGTTFTVRVPRVTDPLAVSDRPAPTSGDGRAGPSSRPGRAAGRRVLVVDDDADTADALLMVVEMCEHVARVAHDGPEALEVGRAFEPEIAFVDIGLPGMDGYELARLLRQEAWASGLALVALSGWGRSADKRRAEEAGFDFHITKPVTFDTVAELLDRVGPQPAVLP